MIKDKFFDRKLYLDILEKRINALKEGYRQNIAIIGDESVGKTSVIFKFLSKFYDTNIITVYLEIRPESQESFIKRFIGVLLYNFLNNSGIPLKEDLGFLINKTQRFAPKTAQKVNSILNTSLKKKQNNSFHELLSLCDIINQETGKFCVVIFDEFHNLESLGFKNMYRDWSKLLISQKNILYIIVSSMKFKTKNILSKHLSLLFGNFEVIAIEPFDLKQSERYLEQKLQGSNLTVMLKNFILHFTGGYPMYLEVITDALKKSEHFNVTSILENLLFDSSGMLNQRFSNNLKRFLDSPNSNAYMSILYLVASGKNRIRDIAHILHKTKKEINKIINHLLELDTITRSADFLRINDRVFGFWLKFVYQEKERSLTFDDKNQKLFFRGKIDNMIEEFSVDTQKPIIERTLELLRLFEDEMVQLERRKIRLNHFREIKTLEFNNRCLKNGLIGRSSDSLWIMAFKQGSLTDEDITAFAKECKKYRHKLQRNIIVALQEIDSNTKLKAMEEKIWTWDISSLNQILDLYSKPWVIV